MRNLKKQFLLCALVCALPSLALAQGALGSGGGGTQNPVIISGPPANCVVGVPYTFTAAAQGGAGGYQWSTNPSTPVPGLGTINASTGILGGNGATCTTPGTYPFQLTLVDMAGGTATAQFSITVSNTLLITPIANPIGDVGIVYTSSTPQATGGTAPYTWSCIGCTYPPGLGPINPTTGVIGPGSPTQQGTFSLQIMVKDAKNATATATEQIIINPAVKFTSNGPPTPVTVNVPYPNFCLTAQGGVGTITFGFQSIFGQQLPHGMALNTATGCISGTPDTVGTSPNINFTATDSLGSQAVSGPWSITVQSSAPSLQFNNQPCGPGTVGVPYNCQLTLTGGTGTGYAFSGPISGSNPPNTSLNNSTGLISGTPLTPGTVTPTYQGTDSGAHTATQAEMITIAGSNGCGPPLYACSSSSTAVIQAPAPPFSTNVGQNQIRYDASINGPGSGLTGVDPIVRATDSTTGGTGFTIDISGGADDNIFSLNDTKIALIPQNTGGICVIAFNPSTMQVTNPCTSVPNTHSMTWSLSNDNLMYGISSNNAKVFKTTFSSPSSFTQTVLIDFTSPTNPCVSLIPAASYTGGSVSISGDESIVYGALVTAGQNSLGYVFAYNQNTTQCSALSTANGQVLLFNGTVTASTMPCTPIGLHNSGIFLNGTWARMSTGAITGGCTNMPQYWQIGTTNVFACVCSCGTGHNSNEWNLEVQISNPTFHWANINDPSYCADLATQTYGSALWLTNGQGGDVEVHFGVNHISSANTEPEFGGTALVNQNAPWQAPVINEMWAMQRSPIKFTRFVHTFNSSMTNCGQCDFRSYEVIVSQSQSGKFGAFCSDMLLGLGTSSNGPRIDVFIVRLD